MENVKVKKRHFPTIELLVGVRKQTFQFFYEAECMKNNGPRERSTKIVGTASRYKTCRCGCFIDLDYDDHYCFFVQGKMYHIAKDSVRPSLNTYTENLTISRNVHAAKPINSENIFIHQTAKEQRNYLLKHMQQNANAVVVQEQKNNHQRNTHEIIHSEICSRINRKI